jgi:hypothetical protein
MGAYCTVNYCSSRGPLFVWVWVFCKGSLSLELSLHGVKLRLYNTDSVRDYKANAYSYAVNLLQNR